MSPIDLAKIIEAAEKAIADPVLAPVTTRTKAAGEFVIAASPEVVRALALALRDAIAQFDHDMIDPPFYFETKHGITDSGQAEEDR